MLRDARTLEDGSVLQADVCVIGGGMAGITLAREFIGHGAKVLLLESGGKEYDQETQSLDAGQSLGPDPYSDPEYDRLRYLGGSSNHWIGVCRPIDAMDFQPRAWVPNSGWPIRREDIWPYYQRAFAYCGLGRFENDPAFWLEPGEAEIPFDAQRFLTAIYRFSPPVAFGAQYGDDLERAANVELLLHANVVDIEAHPDLKKVERVHVATLNGRKFKVEADRFVLSCGGIENARLLLASNKQMSAGLGNQNDVVGRYFLDHAQNHYGQVILAESSDAIKLRSFYKRRARKAQPGDADVQGLLRLAPELQEREQLLNVEWEMLGHAFAGSRGVRAARRLWQEVHLGKDFTNLSRDVGWVMGDLGGIFREVAGRAGWKMEAGDPHQVLIHSYAETPPEPDRRVTLGTERNALGSLEPVVDVHVSDWTVRSMKRTADLVAEEFGRLGLGRMYMFDWAENEEASKPVLGGVHHMGTTRMHDDPKQGVVDAWQKVHGLDNFYIAGTSVFTTSGTTYPSMNMVALTLRLADHLKVEA